MNQSATDPQVMNRRLSIAGAVLGFLALLVAPFILGPLGAFFGFLAYHRGDKPFGLYVGIGSIVTTIIGTAIAVTLLNS